ncbi:hypothetical protein [Ornithinimicrobium faecis]|uniref:hypothetical protein n=1 Tax=Ornithinimicrobium faecis TaxID=2934158 RepID=UPI0021189EE6|nr:hypothetical protein [Ornithinimicrobium sp. HY1745]
MTVTRAPERWATMFRGYARDPHAAWPEGQARHGDKFVLMLDKLVTRTGLSRDEAIDSVVDAARQRSNGRPMTLFLPNCGSSGSHWVEPMLAGFGDYAAGGEVYFPDGIRARLRTLSPHARTTFIDAVHLLHARREPRRLLKQRIINTAHNWRMPDLFHGDVRTVVLTRHPVDIVISRTFRKNSYRSVAAPTEDDRSYLLRNVNVVNSFFENASKRRWDFHLTFEDIRDNGVEALMGLRSALGSDPRPNRAKEVLEQYSEGGSKVESTNLFKGQASVQDWARELAASSLGDHARNFGYDY